MKPNCLFCKIVTKQIPSHIIYEDDATLAFLDIMPVSLGHTLVIPKIHSDNLLATDVEVLHQVNRTMKLVAQHISDSLDVKNFNFITNNGALAGQSVHHLHFHIIPKYKVGEGFNLPVNHSLAKDDSLKQLLIKLKIT